MSDVRKRMTALLGETGQDLGAWASLMNKGAAQVTGSSLARGAGAKKGAEQLKDAQALAKEALSVFSKLYKDAHTLKQDIGDDVKGGGMLTTPFDPKTLRDLQATHSALDDLMNALFQVKAAAEKIP